MPYKMDPVTLVVVIIIAALAICGLALLLIPGQFNLGLTIVMLAAAIGIISYREVRPDQAGLLVVMGHPYKNVGKGPRFAPPPFVDLDVETGTVIQFEIGTPEEVKGRTVQREKPPENTKIIRWHEIEGNKPLRVTFAGLKNVIGSKELMSDEERAGITEDDLLSYRLTTDPHVVIRFQIDDLMQFRQTIGSVIEAVYQIEDEAERRLQARCARLMPAQALWRYDELSDDITKRLEVAIGEKVWPEGEKGPRPPKTQKEKEELDRNRWGINLLSVSVKHLGISYAVNQALEDLADTNSKKQQRVLLAQGQKEALILTGQGEGAGKEAIGKGEAAAIAAKITATFGNVPVDHRLAFMLAQLDTSEEIAGKVKTLIINSGSNVNNLASQVPALIEIAKESGVDLSAISGMRPPTPASPPAPQTAEPQQSAQQPKQGPPKGGKTPRKQGKDRYKN